MTYAATSGGTMLTDVLECTWKTSDVPRHSLEGIEKNSWNIQAEQQAWRLRGKIRLDKL
jgi:hypothetical protein